MNSNIPPAVYVTEDQLMAIKPVVDLVNNKLHYQTDPFVHDGKVKIKRFASYDIQIENVYQLVEEYKPEEK